MKYIISSLLLLFSWSVLAFEFHFPDRLPPEGQWRCKFEGGHDCKWDAFGDKRDQVPLCEKSEDIGGWFELDLDVYPAVLRECYQDGMCMSMGTSYAASTWKYWTISTLSQSNDDDPETFLAVMVVDPENGRFIWEIPSSFGVEFRPTGYGTCTRIESKQQKQSKEPVQQASSQEIYETYPNPYVTKLPPNEIVTLDLGGGLIREIWQLNDTAKHIYDYAWRNIDGKIEKAPFDKYKGAETTRYEKILLVPGIYRIGLFKSRPGFPSWLKADLIAGHSYRVVYANTVSKKCDDLWSDQYNYRQTWLHNVTTGKEAPNTRISHCHVLDYHTYVESDIKVSASPIHNAAEQGDLPEIIRLVEKDENINTKDSIGRTPLHYAVLGQQDAVVELLLNKGANPDIKGGEKEETPLHLAVDSENLKIIKLLVPHMSNIDVQNKHRRKPIDNAFYKGNEAIVTFLMKNGAFVGAEY